MFILFIVIQVLKSKFTKCEITCTFSYDWLLIQCMNLRLFSFSFFPREKKHEVKILYSKSICAIQVVLVLHQLPACDSTVNDNCECHILTDHYHHLLYKVQSGQFFHPFSYALMHEPPRCTTVVHAGPSSLA